MATLAELGGLGKVARKIVVFFDVCSSTAILEDLVSTQNQVKWERVIGQLKRYQWTVIPGVAENRPYKFLGDGWLFLFDSGTIDGNELVAVMFQMRRNFLELFDAHLRNVLTRLPATIGVTFGIDEGPLAHLKINGQPEYVGRALNVAARLQSATKRLNTPAEGVALFSMNAFDRLKVTVESHEEQCELANLAGGQKVRAKRVQLQDVMV